MLRWHRLEDSSVGGDQVPRREHEDVTGTITSARTVASTPSRTTRQVRPRRFFTSSTAADARYSW